MSRAIGDIGEEMAVAFLTGKKWKIIGRNLHYRYGEIDILANDGRQLVVVEVKAKNHIKQGYAVEQITPRKSHTLRRLAQQVENEYNKPVRVDVVAIDSLSTKPIITHYINAVEETA